MRAGGRNGASVFGHHRHQHLRAGHLCADAGFRALIAGNADSARCRPPFRNDLAHRSDLMSPTIPR
ncbi:hypothetical protein BSN85_24960 [Bradyrhizobium brasilense]|nr:hypothetical protein BSN85_24960 [Bradyrhizobium brasilense]